MTKRMLIDATHPEETRVVLLDGKHIEDFDVEVSSRRQLKGNIYLAKVVRVEPSLQAAFVDYGGNRHGFLAFSEIHPDYYQIPVSDREQLLEAEEAEYAAERAQAHAAGDEHADAPAETAGDEHAETEAGTESDAATEAEGDNGAPVPVEVVGGDDEADEIEERHKRRGPSAKQYKIQEVIKRRQVLLVQVVKEERGNKGAALTTYLSLAGRYCVLMPNTARGGGISRKITNAAERKQLKAILGDLEVPDGMAVILRTAGIGRTKAEIKRDFEYLIRLWTNVRDLTLKSTAPTLVHEEGDIVRRAIRDLYSRDFEEVLVEGDNAYRAAKEFMKLLMPSHARRVKQHKDVGTPLLRHYGVEGQLDAIHNPIVQLRSGGYIVINPTEALVSIDVNSGRSTKERNIEETALKTNLEAAEEVARQLRLRDLAGLIVIDFIDMEVNRNNAQVERRLKEALKHDRARIQVGRISAFGLLEMSRQRLRPSIIETSSEPCPYCGGTGIRRSTESTALVVLRAIDEEGANRRAKELTVHVPTAVALYILNHKRGALAELEAKHGMHVVLANDDSLIPPDLRLERTKNQDGETISEMVAAVRADTPDEAGRKRRRRRRGRGKDDMDRPESAASDAAEEFEDEDAAEEEDEEAPRAAHPEGGEGDEERGGEDRKGKRRRRSRRGGRRRRRGQEAGGEQGEAAQSQSHAGHEHHDHDEGAQEDAEDTAAEGESAEVGAEAESSDRPRRRRSRRRRKPAGEGAAPHGAADEAVEGDAAASETDEVGESEPKPSRGRPRRSKPEATQDSPAAEAVTEASPTQTAEAEAQPAPIESTPAEPASVEPAPDKPKKKGWWNLGA